MFKDLGVDSMKVFARKLDLPRTLTRKSELTAALEKELRSNLPCIVTRLSETERKALAQAAHKGGEIARESFKAMYGVEMPVLEPWTYRRKDASLLLMFGEGSSGRFVVFDELLDSLRRFPWPRALGQWPPTCSGQGRGGEPPSTRPGLSDRPSRRLA